MKLSFKRFLSSVLATVMAVAGMSIGMTTTAMAATNTYEYTMTPALNTSSYFTIGGSKNVATTFPTGYDSTGYPIELADGTTSTITEALKMNSSGTVSFKVSGTATVRIVASTKSKSTSTATIGIKKDGTATDNVITMNKDGIYDETFTLSEAGTYQIYRAKTESNLYYVRVDETIDDNAKDYTLSGTTNLTNTTFNLGSDVVTVDETGAFTITKTATSAPFNVGDTLAVSKNDYTANPATVTVAAVSGSDTAFTVGNIEFTEITLSAIAEGTYKAADVEAGKPNFDIANLTGTDGKYRGSMDIILSDTATITLNGKCGSTNTSKNVVVSVSGVDTTYTVAGGSEATDYVFENVPAGTVTITFTSSDTTFQLAGDLTIKYGAVETSSTESTSETTTEAPTDEPSESTTAEETSETTTEAPAVSSTPISNMATLVANDTLSAVTADTVTADGYFTLLTGVSADKNAKEVEGLGDYTYRYKANGKTTLVNGVPSNRGIKFVTTDAGTLQIVAMSASNKEARDIVVYDSTGAVVQTISASGTEPTIATVALTKADTYYIACPSAACNFYSISVVVGHTSKTVATDCTAVTNGVDGYAHIIIPVKAADLANASLSILGATGTEVDNTTSVYSSAVIDGQIVNASDFGGDFMYVIKATGVTADTNYNFSVQMNSAE